MSEQQSFRPSSEARLASRGRRRAACAEPTPTQNHLLAALPLDDYVRLSSALVPVPLPLGWAVHEAGASERDLYFPTSGLVSRVCMMKNGESMEFAITGNEGVIGVASFLGGESTPSKAVVLVPGHAYRLSAALVQHEFERCDALSRLLLRYTQALTTQTGQSAVCNRHHSLEQRLCRWILSCLDRLPASEVTITQEVIGNLLGARREGITAAAAGLQRKGLIRCRRGHIAVLDRLRLEARACECYAVVKREYARLLPGNRQSKSHVPSGLSQADVFEAEARDEKENPNGRAAVFGAA